MKTIKIADLKKFSELGLLEQINIQEDFITEDWLVTFSFKNAAVTGDYELATLETFRGKTRYFKNIDSAYNAIKHINLQKGIYIQRLDCDE